MIASEKIRLSPTKEQEEKFFEFSNIVRFTYIYIYNECLGYKIDCYKSDNYSCTVQDLIEHIQYLKSLEVWLQA